MKTIILVYTGRCKLVGGKIAHKYYNEETQEIMTFTKKIIPMIIGSRVQCEETDTGVKAPYKLLEQIKDTSKIDQWHNEDKALSDSERLRKMQNKPSNTAYDKHIEALKTMILKMPRNQRRIFEMRIIHDIMNI